MKFERKGNWVTLEDGTVLEVVHVQIGYHVWNHKVDHQSIYWLVEIDIDEATLVRKVKPGPRSGQKVIKNLLGKLYDPVV